MKLLRNARLTILGPPVLTCAGARVDLGTPQQQAVATVLLANAGSYVPLARLVDDLWGPSAPSGPGSVVRTYVSRLRRVLAPFGLDQAIKSRPGCYLLDPVPFAVDAEEFDSLSTAARREPGVRAAKRLLDDALALWSGTALAGVPGETAERERSRLSRLRLDAVEDWLWLRIELGEHREVAAGARLLIDENRWEEPLYEIYLTALHRSGRRAEALAAYRSTRELFSRELEVVPGPRLQAVHEEILAGVSRRAS
ncbi:AfsR/SARP family transcriptional regulator [Amycolatopsis benzoatilytica]|uniref:AfsR/SARP family transcriptional regulator n=1 Tax=Amycolatopsis benzoatilytica TaxID=346045 RepID=UPI0003A792A6|nr:AfsR/SARP family transcriptional regulator [Amycolatopsis benzoatilytica]